MKDSWQNFGFISCSFRMGVEKTKTEERNPADSDLYRY